MPSDNRLPDSYDRVVAVDRLRHGAHNVRQASPSDRLKRSIEKDGLTNPLTVRVDAGDDALHITDGWQRYQAAVELGWTELPVNVYDDTVAALEAAEAQSIVREWTTFQAARHVKSLYQELLDSNVSESVAIEAVAERTARSKPTVRRYLSALQLPDIVLPLLKDKENITESEWTALKNYKSGVARYDGLSWGVAETAANHMGQFDRERLIRVLLATLEYGTEDGKRLVRGAADDPTASLEMLHYRLFEGAGTEYNCLRVPQTAVPMEGEQKQTVLDYCHEHKIHLSDIVETQMQRFAERVNRPDRNLNEFYDD